MSENEKKLCEECGQREAMCIVGVAMGDQMTQRHLCHECMARMSMSIAAGNIGQLLGSIMAAVGHGPAPKKPAPELPKENSTCHMCGTTLHGFIQTGRLGCAGCYRAFASHITPMLEKVNSSLEYRGRSPLNTEAAQRIRRQREELQARMEAAAAAEDFEQAARWRDALRAMAGEEAAG